MSKSISDFFQQAQLAEAAYSLFDQVNYRNKQEVIDALTLKDNKGEFSVAQATAFADTWEVIDHIPDTAAGFSATIFQSRQTGAYSLAIRGSTDLIDFAADAALIAVDGIAIRQVVDLYNFWQRATTAENQSYRAAFVTLRDRTKGVRVI